MSADPDMTLRHYQPAGRSAVCGAKSRVISRIESGETQDKYALLKVPTSSNIEQVECPLCREAIKRYVNKSW